MNLSESARAHPEADAIDARVVLARTRAWVARAVVGLNLCPFAKAPLVKDQIRFVVCDATDPQALLDALRREMHDLARADPARHETTLLIHPRVLEDFLDFNDFLDRADAALEEVGCAGVLQVASFHPDYRFAGTEPDEPGNATNRSPYPTLHLLREDSVERAVAAFGETDAIVDANIRTLEALGAQGWSDLQARCREDANASIGRPLVAEPR
ncbi:MAG: DUF1415 domain-containing protein [Burkholderiaceae bacterium]